MNLTIKQTSIVIAISGFLCLFLRFGLNYYVGYYETSDKPMFFDIILLLSCYLVILVLLINWLISWFKGGLIWTTTALIVFLIFNGFGSFHVTPTPARLLLYGMRNRLLHDYSLDVIRNFARDFDQLPTIPRLGPRRIYTNKDLAKTELKKKYPFLRWIKGPSPDFDGPSYIEEVNNVVKVRWWSGLWGFNVAVDGQKIDLPIGPKVFSLRLSDDIYLIFDQR